MIQTHNFHLAVYAQGNETAEKVAIVLPGFLDSKNHSHMKSHVEYLATKGFYALSFDPLGTWESDGRIEQYTMTNWLLAIKEIIEYYGSRPTFTLGTSRGGSMAMLAAIHCPEVFAFAAIMSKASYAPAVSTIHPIAEWKAAGYREFAVTNPIRRNEKCHFKIPYSVVEDTQQYDMTADLRVLHKPKLFIAGLQDTTVTADVVQTAYDQAAQPKKFITVDSDHLYRRRPEIIAEINQAVGEFLDGVDRLDLKYPKI